MEPKCTPLYFTLEINAAPSPAPKLEVRFQALPSEDSGAAKELTMAATQLPVLAGTPQGIQYSVALIIISACLVYV